MKSKFQLQELVSTMVMITADKSIYSIGIGGTGAKTIDALSMLGNTQGRNDVPLTDIMFLLDCTRSMANKLGQIKGFINNFTEKLVSQANDTRLGLIEFRDRQMGEDHQVHTFESTTNTFTQNLTLFNHTLDNLEAEGGFGYEASGLDAILFALNQPFREESKKVIVLFTDGNPRFPDVETKTIKQVATAIQEVGAQFYVVSLSGSSIADDPLNICQSEMASSTIASMAGELFKQSEYSKYLNKILKLAGKQSDFQVYQKLVRKVEGEFFNYHEDETKLMNNLLCCSSEELIISEYGRIKDELLNLAKSINLESDYGEGYKAGFNDYLNLGHCQGIKVFFDEGGQIGKQRAILTTGNYRINTAMFKVKKITVTKIEEHEIGLVEALDGEPLPHGEKFATKVNSNNFQDAQAFFDNGGQAGKQLATLEPGSYYINPEIFTIRVPVIRIPKGEIGLVIANEGASKSDEQILGKVVECDQFQNAEAFLKNEGRKGKQLAILTEGDYKINTDFFTIITTANAHEYNEDPENLKIYKIGSGKIGIVTTTVGKTLPRDEIAGSVIEEQNHFEDPRKILDVGGYKGLQEEVIQEGEWKLTLWFEIVEQVTATIIEQEEVGVVISSVGKKYEENDNNQPVSPSGEESPYQLVPKGYKWVENTPLLAGYYAINPEGKIVGFMPTTQIILNWSHEKDEKRDRLNYDYELKTMKLKSKDVVQFTQMLRISPETAPNMICLVGSQVGEDKIEVDDSGKKKYQAISNLLSRELRILTKFVCSHLRQAAAARSAIYFQKQRGNIEKTAVQEYKKYLHSKISCKLLREQITIRKMKISFMSQLWKSFISQSQLNLTSKIYHQYVQLRASPNLQLDPNLIMTKKIKLKKEIPKIVSLFIVPYKDYRFSLRL